MASCCAPIVYAAPACPTLGSSLVSQRGKSLASTSFTCVGNDLLHSSESAPYPSEYHLTSRCRRPESALLNFLYSPTAQPSRRNSAGFPSSSPHQLDALRCCATEWNSRSDPMFNLHEGYILGSSSIGQSGAGWEADGGTGHQRTRRTGIVCKASGGSSVGSLHWMSRATPYEVLGISADSNEEEIKSAFRARIKEYHPDVYQGLGDADAITQRLLRAYELLMVGVERTTFTRKSFDPFEEPECVADDVFVNELACIGRGCPYSCVERAPDVFQFAPDTGRARAVNQDTATRKAGEYHVQLAVGQCPNNCIHYLTPEQRFRLEEILKSVLEGTIYSSEVVIMDGLIARANFENGRYQRPKRKAKKSEKWVDWY